MLLWAGLRQVVDAVRVGAAAVHAARVRVATVHSAARSIYAIKQIISIKTTHKTK